MFSQFRWKVGTVWCNLNHDSVLWPVHGHYLCRTCGRRYPAFSDAPVASRTKRAAFKGAVAISFLGMALAIFPRAAEAADELKGQPSLGEQAALDRYTALAGAGDWATESVEIHASLSNSGKSGRLRAIRRLAPIGESRYEVLQLTGDRTVKEQVIVRYLRAVEQASELSAASVSITPANYKFTYKGVIDDGERLAYSFRIIPRHKRDGLIKGELWLDQRTGAPVAQFGRLVKCPSIFIKRVSVARENALRDGIVESRLTHITVETRLIGRAELVIEERPLTSVDASPFPGRDKRGGQQ